jgi:protein TonB
MGILSNSFWNALLSRRGAVLAAVAGLHVVVLVAAVQARTRVTLAPEPARIHVAIIEDDAPHETPPQLEVPPPPRLVIPTIEMPVVEIPESQTITPLSPPQGVAAIAPPPPAAAPALVQSTAPVVLADNEIDYQRMPEPRYPRAAKQARLQGTVLVWVLIDQEGRPREVRVHKSSGYEQLDQEGCDAVSRALFQPYRERGVPRSAQAIVPVEFALNSGTARRR